MSTTEEKLHSPEREFQRKYLVRFLKNMVEVAEEDPEREAPSTIYRVLEAIREQDHRAYDPKIITIGPFHNRLFDKEDSNKLLTPAERLKCRFLRDLIRRHTSNSVEKYLLQVTSTETEAIKCYSETPVTRTEFLAMMVLDGCFIIEFLVKTFHHMERNVQMHLEHWDILLLRNDLLMLENQIPFSVLQCLFNSTMIPTLPADMTLKELAVKCFNLRTDVLNFIPDVIHHLLHLFHSCLCPPPPANASPCVSWSVSDSFYWMLSFLKKYRRPEPPVERAPRRIPRATEIDEAGVKFKAKKDAMSFLDVTFRIRDGTMEIPLIAVESLTVSFLRNLVAFEMCCPESERHVTSYAALMNSLIGKPEDVALLERSGVIQNMLLGGTEEMVRFYNSLDKAASLDYEQHYLAGLFKDVRKYYGKDRHRWRAIIVRNFAWVAIVVFVLSFLQTFFAVFAYFRPPKSPQ